jgi:Zn finger protein HypA/HybF involved in hydrogenase expression
MQRVKTHCDMCQLEFFGRRGSKTCSPRCRKRRQRVLKGTALATWPMLQPPTTSSSKIWR